MSPSPMTRKRPWQRR